METFQKNVLVRRAHEAMEEVMNDFFRIGRLSYTDIELYKEGSRTRTREVKVLDGVPCRLRYVSADTTRDRMTASGESGAKLYTRSGIRIPEGATVTVEQNGETYVGVVGRVMAMSAHNEYTFEVKNGKL